MSAPCSATPPATRLDSAIPPSPATLAPPRRLLGRPHPGQRLSPFRYFFPQSLRHRYREGLIDFRLNTLPYYKQRVQGRIYRYLIEHERRRRDQSRLVDQAWRLLTGQRKRLRPKHGIATRKLNMTSTPGTDVGDGYGYGYGQEPPRERGARRRKLAAMASNAYRAAGAAVTEIKESYNQTRAGEMDSPEITNLTIPGSFPDVSIVTKGNEQMVLFPSYAKQHVKGSYGGPGGTAHPSDVDYVDEEEYWRQQWARHEDETAIVDVDVRGWIYNPHRGPLTRRNRVLVGLARQLSGIPLPKVPGADAAITSLPASSMHQQNEEARERESIAREARQIERRGRAEERAAQQGTYSERPKDESSEEEGDGTTHSWQRSSRSPTPSIKEPATSAQATGNAALTEAELAAANLNLMARIGPFLTTPLVDQPITLFFYNDTQSRSRTVMTDESGHFTARAALDFVPTHVRVLANEDISCTEPVRVIEPCGVSLISDIDDTIKRSNIALGTKEIFRNTFVRELNDLTIDGVQDWYNSLHDMGVNIHYCSNSPWQLYPVLATYFKLAGLPPGSLHLKRYSGMLQGIFEPVAERKKGTLEKIMHDFPERKFLLVGDSGEADLEVYTELAVANPGRIKAIFIRDVTTPERPGYFDAAYSGGVEPRSTPRVRQDRLEQSSSTSRSADIPGSRPALPPRNSTGSENNGRVIDDLIDLSEEPTPMRRSETANLPQGRKPPPPKPTKPSTLRSSTASSNASVSPRNTTPVPAVEKTAAPAPPLPRRPFPNSSPGESSNSTSTKSSSLHPLSQIHNSSDQNPRNPHPSTSNVSSRSSTPSENVRSSRGGTPPPPPPPRRRGTPSSTSTTSNTNTNTVPGAYPNPLPIRRRTAGVGVDSDLDFDASVPLSKSMTSRSTPTHSGATTPAGGAHSPLHGQNQSNPAANKKLELWLRRLERAQDVLSNQRVPVPLYTWRRGGDVVVEARGIVEGALRENNKRGRGGR
ncbi:hypothetical protein F4808DRAFT_466257 [Astrocystis sublimbata]|nr:hypothetical protein F4808DRAFT_466257 [Astrocystis sublimbata]